MEKQKYNKVFDLEPVDQVGFLDIHDVFENGVISGDFSFTDEAYNNASPADMMHRPDDIFAGYRQRDLVKSSLAAQTESEQVTS